MKRFLSFALTLALTLTCFSIPALAEAPSVKYIPIDKGDAKVLSSADDAVKIPSNAHQDAVPGINFHWADKQKDDCVLTVDPSIFTQFDRFTVLVKDANEYAYVAITAPGKYSFPKFMANDKLHNINMVWLCDFVEHIAYHDYEVTVVSNNSSKISTSRYMRGNDAENVPFDGAAVETDAGSKYGPNTWWNGLTGDENLAALKAFDPRFIWNAGSDGIDNTIAKSGEVVKFTQDFLVAGTRVTDQTDLYIAGDNGFLVFLNGKFVGQSDTILHTYGSTAMNSTEIADVFGDLTKTGGYVEHGKWQHIYALDLSGALRVGRNTLTIYAYNTAEDKTVTDTGARYDALTNPAGIVYGFRASSTNRPL